MVYYKVSGLKEKFKKISTARTAIGHMVKGAVMDNDYKSAKKYLKLKPKKYK